VGLQASGTWTGVPTCTFSGEYTYYNIIAIASTSTCMYNFLHTYTCIYRINDIEADNEDGYTALHLASAFGHLDTTIALLNRGAKIDARDLLQETPVHRACIEGHFE